MYVPAKVLGLRKYFDAVGALFGCSVNYASDFHASDSLGARRAAERRANERAHPDRDVAVDSELGILRRRIGKLGAVDFDSLLAGLQRRMRAATECGDDDTWHELRQDLFKARARRRYLEELQERFDEIMREQESRFADAPAEDGDESAPRKTRGKVSMGSHKSRQRLFDRVMQLAAYLSDPATPCLWATLTWPGVGAPREEVLHHISLLRRRMTRHPEWGRYMAICVPELHKKPRRRTRGEPQFHAHVLFPGIPPDRHKAFIEWLNKAFLEITGYGENRAIDRERRAVLVKVVKQGLKFIVQYILKEMSKQMRRLRESGLVIKGVRPWQIWNREVMNSHVVAGHDEIAEGAASWRIERALMDVGAILGLASDGRAATAEDIDKSPDIQPGEAVSCPPSKLLGAVALAVSTDKFEYFQEEGLRQLTRHGADWEEHAPAIRFKRCSDTRERIAIQFAPPTERAIQVAEMLETRARMAGQRLCEEIAGLLGYARAMEEVPEVRSPPGEYVDSHFATIEGLRFARFFNSREYERERQERYRKFALGGPA